MSPFVLAPAVLGGYAPAFTPRAAGPANVGEIATATGRTLMHVSQNLPRLKDGGVVEAERDGRFMVYRLVGAEVMDGKLILRRPGVGFVMALATPAGKKKGKT